MDIETYRAKYQSGDAAPGWEAIDLALKKLYPDQQPKHFGTTLKYMLGGQDPIDGISVYDAGDSIHLVTYGFSELYYDEEAVGGEFSKFGFELTMRLKKGEDPVWAMNMLQNIARYVFKSGNWLEAGHYMPALGPIKLDSDTKLVALAFAHDPELEVTDTAHGRVEFLEVFGITEKEYQQINDVDKNANKVLAKHRLINPLLITDLERDEI